MRRFALPLSCSWLVACGGLEAREHSPRGASAESSLSPCGSAADARPLTPFADPAAPPAVVDAPVERPTATPASGCDGPRPADALLCVDTPSEFPVDRLGVHDGTRISFPPGRYRQVEVFRTRHSTQLIIYRREPPDFVGCAQAPVAPVRFGSDRNFAQAEREVQVGGELLLVHCLGHASVADEVRRVCDATVWRWCD